MQNHQPRYLVSACLVGLCTRYDGKSKRNSDCLSQCSNLDLVPVCPEQLGGLPTPREAADIIGGDGNTVLNGSARVLTRSGVDVTGQFIRGAGQVLEIARLLNVTKAFLKGRSPSCAVHGKIGVTAALLQSEGIEVQEF